MSLDILSQAHQSSSYHVINCTFSTAMAVFSENVPCLIICICLLFNKSDSTRTAQHQTLLSLINCPFKKHMPPLLATAVTTTLCPVLVSADLLALSSSYRFFNKSPDELKQRRGENVLPLLGLQAWQNPCPFFVVQV